MEQEEEKKYVHTRSEELQEIFDEVIAKTGESEKTVRKVLYNAANYIRTALQEPERPEVRWSGLLCWRLMPKRIEQYVERIDRDKDDPYPRDEKKREFYMQLLDMIKKYSDGSWKES